MFVTMNENKIFFSKTYLMFKPRAGDKYVFYITTLKLNVDTMSVDCSIVNRQMVFVYKYGPHLGPGYKLKGETLNIC